MLTLTFHDFRVFLDGIVLGAVLATLILPMFHRTNR